MGIVSCHRAQRQASAPPQRHAPVVRSPRAASEEARVRSISLDDFPRPQPRSSSISLLQPFLDAEVARADASARMSPAADTCMQSAHITDEMDEVSAWAAESMGCSDIVEDVALPVDFELYDDLRVVRTTFTFYVHGLLSDRAVTQSTTKVNGGGINPRRRFAVE